jgi:hypothetical protein
MPRAKGKANYEAELLISIIEEKLPQGSMGWQEVAALTSCNLKSLLLVIMRMSRGIGLRNFVTSLKTNRGPL